MIEKKRDRDRVIRLIEESIFVNDKFEIKEGQGRKIEVHVCETNIGKKCMILFRAKPEEIKDLAEFFGESDFDEIRVLFRDEPPGDDGQVGALLRFLKPNSAYRDMITKDRIDKRK